MSEYKPEPVRGYRVTATLGNETVRFMLPIGCKQNTVKEARESAYSVCYDIFSDSVTPSAFTGNAKIKIEETFKDE